MEEDRAHCSQGRPPKEIFTIGHGKRSWESFLELLRFHGIRKVVDVRAYPASRKSPHFSREHLEVSLAEAGIVYRWEGRALGGFREPREGSRNISLRNPGMRGYADHMAGEEFRKAVSCLEEDAAHVCTAVMCAEIDPFHCHRGLLADYLTARGVMVKHIRSKANPLIHRISPLARVEGEVLVYDRSPTAWPIQEDTGAENTQGLFTGPAGLPGAAAEQMEEN
ncbi:MAG: DUF488 domain-containing protein [bacterium]